MKANIKEKLVIQGKHCDTNWNNLKLGKMRNSSFSEQNNDYDYDDVLLLSSSIYVLSLKLQLLQCTDKKTSFKPMLIT